MGERCMRLFLREAPTHQKEQHKGQPQHRELYALFRKHEENMTLLKLVFAPFPILSSSIHIVCLKGYSCLCDNDFV